jgi:hypothetical protein
MRRLLRLVVAGCTLLATAAASATPTDEELAVLREQVEALEEQLERTQELLVVTRKQLDALEDSASAPESAEEPVEAPAEKGIHVGGAVRLNYSWKEYDDGQVDRVGDSTFELFRLDLNGEVGGLRLSAQYRWYPDFEAVHHAWVGTSLGELWEAELGVTQVPFGLLPYASHGFWFGGTYYLGLEDDHDLGLKFIRTGDDWTLHAAFFKNPEYADDTRAGRYSFDLVTAGDQQNEEIDQLNFRAERALSHGGGGITKLGLSVQAGRLYNSLTEEHGHHAAFAAHLDGRYGPWNLQLQAARLDYQPRNPDGVSDELVQLGGFGFPFLSPSRATVLSANVAHEWKLSGPRLNSVTLYNDLTWIEPHGDGLDASIQNVMGALFQIGPLYTYVDWVAGRNMWFAGGPGIGLPDEDDDWQLRLNVNVGFYF